MTDLRVVVRGVVLVTSLALCAVAGCQSRHPGAIGGAEAGADSGMEGGGAGGMDAGGAAGADDAGASDSRDDDAAPACPLTSPPLHQSGGTLAFAIEPRLGDRAFVFGEPNPAALGVRITPLNFRFFVSHVALLRAQGAPVPVDLVTATGALEPYGVHLFNAEEPTSQTLRVLAPAGSYTGLTFLLGLDAGCNSGLPDTRQPPLTAASQLTWPHLFGYLFLRYEARVSIDAGDAAATDAGDAAVTEVGATDAGDLPFPTAVHMGGIPGRLAAPTVSVKGDFAIANGQVTMKPVVLDMGAFFAGAEQAGDPSTLAGIVLPPGPEVQLGENLRQHAPGLALFVFAP